MNIINLTTGGSAQETGRIMRQVVEKYYQDMAPYASLSLIEIFDRIRSLPYRTDPPDTETLMRPRFTMQMQGWGGDCLSGDTRLLTVKGYKNISDINAGDVIMGKKGWTRVVLTADKGLLPVRKYSLSNGGEFIATDNHRCLLEDGTEMLAGDLTEGQELFQCLYVPGFGSIKLTTDDCRFIGYYLSDGWIDNNRVCISGKDGFPKEEQKRWVQKYAEGKGWATSWHSRYIRVYIPANDYVKSFLVKKTAVDKYIDIEAVLKMDRNQTYDLLLGLMADSYQSPDRASGTCFGSISKDLMYAVVLLYRKLGIGCTFRLIVDHGGFGKHSIWRVYPRLRRKQCIKVQKIEIIGIRHVYDLETEDHGIYLPDADIVVHNCDCKAVALASYARLYRIPYRFVAIRRPGRNCLHHVALELYINSVWVFCDPTYRFNTLGRKRPEAERVYI